MTQSLLALPPLVPLGDGIVLLPGRAGAAALEAALAIIESEKLRVFETPGGQKMSVRSTNCGALGWVSDRRGYRYVDRDPATDNAWPPMPQMLRALAVESAEEAGFPGFAPEACLVNIYEPHSKMGLHQDRDEGERLQPVVSLSFGRSCRFRFGGTVRGGKTRTIQLNHGDILVFGGAARLMYHGVDRLDGPPDPALGPCRLNLTFRRVTPVS